MNTINEIEIYKESSLKFVGKLIKIYLFGLLTKRSFNLFSRGKDTIGVAPQIFGIHEEPLTRAIKFKIGKLTSIRK